MRVENGSLSYGRSCVPNDGSNCFFKALVRTLGFLTAAMAWPVEYTRLKEDDRFSGVRFLAEAQWRLNTLISGSVFPAYLTVFGSNPVDLYG